MSGKGYDLGKYIENPPSIFDIIREQTGTQYPKLQAFLKVLQDKILPLLGNISKDLEKSQDRMEDAQRMEKDRQTLIELQNIENEYVWAKFIEIESQKRANIDLTQKLESEIIRNQTKLDEITKSFSPIRAQYEQKNETVQTEFRKFRAINAELQQLFKAQNQILRKTNQIETQLNDPKAKKTPDEISALEKEFDGLHVKEKEIRQGLPQKQKSLESQRILHQEKEKEFRPIKIKYDGMVAEQAKLEQMIKGDNTRLQEKQKEFEEISKKSSEFIKLNNLNLQDRPPTIRTKNILENKIKILRTNLHPDFGLPEIAQDSLTNNKSILSSFQELSVLLETFQISEIQPEISALSQKINTIRNQASSKFSNLMNGIDKKGGVQIRSLITSNGLLRFCESGKEDSISSVLTFLLSIYAGKSSQIKINSSNLTATQLKDLKGLVKLIQSKTDSDIKISEE